ncbi:MAG: hypothetical protein M1825_001158 [Sarcosagium campestre]|nr:MAG: hypothetical protein M1825_001158 [Sarcosagium campestre]
MPSPTDFSTPLEQARQARGTDTSSPRVVTIAPTSTSAGAAAGAAVAAAAAAAGGPRMTANTAETLARLPTEDELFERVNYMKQLVVALNDWELLTARAMENDTSVPQERLKVQEELCGYGPGYDDDDAAAAAAAAVVGGRSGRSKTAQGGRSSSGGGASGHRGGRGPSGGGTAAGGGGVGPSMSVS